MHKSYNERRMCDTIMQMQNASMWSPCSSYMQLNFSSSLGGSLIRRLLTFVPQLTRWSYNETSNRVYFRPNLSYSVYTNKNARIHYIWKDRWSGWRQPINVKCVLCWHLPQRKIFFWSTLFLEFVLFSD